MNKKEYIEKLYEFTERKNTTIYNYYKKLAILCRKHKNFEIIGFEAYNPFLTPEDYKKLLDSSDELMPEFFARAMVKVVSFNELIFAEEEKLAKEQAEKAKLAGTEVKDDGKLSLSIIRELIDEEYEKVDEREKENESNALAVPSQKGLMVIEPKCTALVPVKSSVKREEQPKKAVLSRETIKNIIDKVLYREDKKERMPKEIAEQYLKMHDTTSQALVPVTEQKETTSDPAKEEVTVASQPTKKSKKNDKKSVILDRLMNRSNSKDKVATVLERLTKGTEAVEEEQQEVQPEIKALPVHEDQNGLLALPAYKEPILESTALVPAQPKTLARIDIMDSINQAMENIATEEETSIAVIEQPKKKKLFNFTSINLGIIEKLKGLALIRESKTGKADIFYHDPLSKKLKGRTPAGDIHADSGYYVNYQEYVYKMIANTMNKYPNATELRFVSQDGEEKQISEVVEEVFKTLREAGAIRFGNEYANTRINGYSDLKKIKPGYGVFANERLKKGIYVRRDILVSEFKKYKLRFVMKQDEEEVTYKKTK